MEFLGAEVIYQYVEGEDVLESVDGEVFVEKGRHGGVVKGEDSDGLAAVDLASEVGGGEVVVEGGEFGVFGKNSCDVVAIGGGGN